jgi:hypothetical protein
MHCGGCWVGHSMVICLGGMVAYVGDNSLELSTNASSFGSECELSSPSVDTLHVTNVVGVSVDTSIHKSFEMHKQIKTTREPIFAKPLPLALSFQLDNCPKDNKCRYKIYFWSFFCGKLIFFKLFMSILILGHTHDNINVSFVRWSMK